MSEVSRCSWYNPCSWFNCCFEEETGAREPLTGSINHDAPKTPESQIRHISTPGNTPTKSTVVKGEAVTGDQQWE